MSIKIFEKLDLHGQLIGKVEWLDTQKERCEQMALSDNDNEYRKSKFPPENSLFIEWTYTYDLDNLVFVVDSQAFFRIQAIAQKYSNAWISFLSLDAGGDRCLSLETPWELVAQLKTTSYPFLGKDPIPSLNDFVPTSTIPSSTWSQPLTPQHRRLMLALVNVAIAQMYGKLSSFHWPDPSSETQDLAKSFLEAVVPNNHAIVANQQSPTHPNAESSRSPHFSRDPMVWFHETPPSPPRGYPWFWYRGCLVLLVCDLENNEHFQIYVQAVAARAKAKNRDRCTAVLWSIRHVAVVEISGGTVSHTDPLPLIMAYGSDEDGFMNALHLLWHYLPDPRWRIVQERMTSQGHNTSDFGGLPTEIVMKIMSFTDQLHYPKYQFLSHAFFRLWSKQLRVASLTILPDAEEATSRYFNAYSPDSDMLVKLRLKLSFGKTTGSMIWRTDTKQDEELLDDSWTLNHFEHKKDLQDGDKKDFYRVQRFYSYWPEDLTTSMHDLPRVKEQFFSESYVLNCKVQPL